MPGRRRCPLVRRLDKGGWIVPGRRRCPLVRRMDKGG